MLTLPDLILRYPKMATLSPERFAFVQKDTVLIMGTDDGRWGTPNVGSVYDPAQAALIAHIVTINNGQILDDNGMQVGPLSRTDVDDVQVEFADIWKGIPYQEAYIYSTSYGQEYANWRRMFFAGPRVQ